jgi:hypothetical protein
MHRCLEQAMYLEQDLAALKAHCGQVCSCMRLRSERYSHIPLPLTCMAIEHLNRHTLAPPLGHVLIAHAWT